MISRLIALAGTIVFARTLPAEEFGVFVLGATLMISIDSVVRAGFGAGLIGRLKEPTHAELETVVAVNGMLIGATVALTTVICVLAGGSATVVALMVALMPVTAFRAPGVISYERTLSYRRLAQVEVLETTALYGLGAVLVAAGAGLSGVAVAAGVRAIGGTIVMVRTSPLGLVWPRLSACIVRDLAAFAGRYQGVALVNAIRDQSVNLGIAVVGGVTMLGTYAVASRLLQAPQILLEALFRVSYPAMARLNEAGEDARNVVERSLKAVALGTGAIVAPLSAASADLIPAVFGERWSEAATVVPPVSLALMIGGPVAVAAAGYLFAVDAGGTVLRSAVLHTAAWFAIALPLLIPLGVIAAGLGVVAAGCVEALILGRAVHRRTGAKILKGLVIPLLAAAASTVAGVVTVALIALDRGPEAVMAALVAGAAYSAIVLAFQRADLMVLFRLFRSAARPATA